MEPERLERLLREAAAPAEDAARERAWDSVGVAYEQRRVRQRVQRRAPVAIAAAVAALAFALSPPGDAVADWVRDAVGIAPNPAAERAVTAETLPTGGRLLVSAGDSTWFVERDGKHRRLGAWSGAAWSPHGLFIVVWRGRRLAALDPRGRVRWSFQAPRPISDAQWSPSGFRIAYRSGSDLRVVAGDGNDDRVLDPGTFRPTAWRPGVREHVLAYSSGGHIDIVDADTRARLARIRVPHVPGALAWSADGRRLYVNLHRSIAVYDARGRRTGRIGMPGRLTVSTFTPARRGSLVAGGGSTPTPAAATSRSWERTSMRGCCSAATGASRGCVSPPTAAGFSWPGPMPTSGCSSGRVRRVPSGSWRLRRCRGGSARPGTRRWVGIGAAVDLLVRHQGW